MSNVDSVVCGGTPLGQLSDVSGLHAAVPRNTVSSSAKVFCSSFSFHRLLGALRLESSVIDRPCTRTLVHYSASSSSSCPVGQSRQSTLVLGAIFFPVCSLELKLEEAPVGSIPAEVLTSASGCLIYSNSGAAHTRLLPGFRQDVLYVF